MHRKKAFAVLKNDHQYVRSRAHHGNIKKRLEALSNKTGQMAGKLYRPP